MLDWDPGQTAWYVGKSAKPWFVCMHPLHISFHKAKEAKDPRRVAANIKLIHPETDHFRASHDLTRRRAQVTSGAVSYHTSPRRNLPDLSFGQMYAYDVTGKNHQFLPLFPAPLYWWHFERQFRVALNHDSTRIIHELPDHRPWGNTGDCKFSDDARIKKCVERANMCHSG